MIEIHPTAFVSPKADIEDSVKGSRIVIGAGSYVDSFVKFKAAGGTGDIVIGEQTFINSGCVFYVGNGITIGNNVSIAANCVLAPTNHEFADASVLHQRQVFRPSKGGILIEDDVWVGAGTIILDGSTIGRGAVIGAQSLVRSSCEPLGIYAGNPLTLIDRRS